MLGPDSEHLSHCKMVVRIRSFSEEFIEKSITLDQYKLEVDHACEFIDKMMANDNLKSHILADHVASMIKIHIKHLGLNTNDNPKFKYYLDRENFSEIVESLKRSWYYDYDAPAPNTSSWIEDPHTVLFDRPFRSRHFFWVVNRLSQERVKKLNLEAKAANLVSLPHAVRLLENDLSKNDRLTSSSPLEFSFSGAHNSSYNDILSHQKMESIPSHLNRNPLKDLRLINHEIALQQMDLSKAKQLSKLCFEMTVLPTDIYWSWRVLELLEMRP
jgi:hypothetical protein